jgi:hypothetical protein
LKSIGELDRVQSTMNDGDHISQVDLTRYLSEKQIADLEGFDSLDEYINGSEVEFRCNGAIRQYCRRLYPYCNDGGVDIALTHQRTIYRSCGRYYKILARFCTTCN